MIELKVKIIKLCYEKEMYKIYSLRPVGNVPPGITLSNWGTFSIKGQLPILLVGKKYDLVLKVTSTDNTYGSCCEVIDIPTLANIDMSKLSREDSFEVLRQIGTGSDDIANALLDAYPDIIHILLTDGKEAVDLSKIKGVGDAYISAYERNLRENYSYWHVGKKLQPYGVTINEARTLMDTYGSEDAIVDVLKVTPYEVLIDTLHQSFERADKTILEVSHDDFYKSETRCAYFVKSLLQENESFGNTIADASVLYQYAIEHNYPELSEGEMMVDVIKSHELFYYDENEQTIAIKKTYDLENRLARFIKRKLSTQNVLDIDTKCYMDVDGFKLTNEQGRLLDMFCNNDIMILKGVSGSGKTSSIKALVKLMDENHLSYTLLAPTGAAALRLAEQTNKGTSTIHRSYYKDKELHTDVVLVDEAGMVALETFDLLLSLLEWNENAKVVFCGDDSQLPPIGLGCCFSDMINSGIIPTVTLTKIFRYDTNGGCFVAENVRNGNKFLDDERVVVEDNVYKIYDNYKFIQTNDIFENVVEEYNKLREIYSEDEIAILCPYNVDIGGCGTYKLNSTIEGIELGNGAKNDVLGYVRDRANISFKVGSKVINIKNNYCALTREEYLKMISNPKLKPQDMNTKIIFNGEMGRVVEVKKDYLVALFDNELIAFSKDDLSDLLLGRAISVHRSQGGEWKACINIVSPHHKPILSRQLLYVADTRAREIHIDIGDRDTYEEALDVDIIECRKTLLPKLLTSDIME